MNVELLDTPLYKIAANHEVSGSTTVGVVTLSPAIKHQLGICLDVMLAIIMLLFLADTSFLIGASVVAVATVLMVTTVMLNQRNKPHIRIDGNIKEVAYYRPSLLASEKRVEEIFSISKPRNIVVKIQPDGTKALFIACCDKKSQLVVESKSDKLIHSLSGKLKEMLGVEVIEFYQEGTPSNS
jgi:hypothetical protein